MPRVEGAGPKNTYVTLQRPAESSKDSRGEPTITWSDLGTMYISLRPISGNEYFAARQVQASTTHVARAYYRSDISIDTACRLKRVVGSTTRYFYIEGWVDLDEVHREWELMLREETNG